MKVWITKYALTKGVYEANVEVSKTSDGVVIHRVTGCFPLFFHGEGKDWHRTEDSALARAEKMRSAKLTLLRKQLAAIEALTFGGEEMTDATAFTDYKAKKAQAGRGKAAEKAVQTYLERKQESLGIAFDWERVPDARAAGGRFKPVTGDYRAFYGGKSANIEVKEVDTTDRLPKKNFSRDQIARCYRRWRAGVVTVVLIHHTKSDQWVVAPISDFFEQDVPSWLTSGYPSFLSAEKALDFALQDLF